MTRGQMFADVLEREMHRGRSAPDTRPSAASSTYLPPNPFLFASYETVTAAGDVRRSAAVAMPHAPRVRPAPSTPAPAERRPARILPARERRALRELVALGAELEPDFTAGELRRAFCTLARRYHPDSHPGANETTKARLSQTFTVFIESHRCLRAVAQAGPTRH